MSETDQSEPLDVDDYGAALRDWRHLRGFSQLELATEAEISQRHLSFLETGRARPSREMVGHLARVLRIAPREQNGLLMAAGFAPGFSETPSADLGEIGDAIDFLLDAHAPNMAIVVDRDWNLVSGNEPSSVFTSAFLQDAPLFEDAVNVLHLMFHPDGFRPHITNFASAAPALLWRLLDDIERSPTHKPLQRLYEGLRELAGPGISPASVPANAGLVDTIDFVIDGEQLSLFSCIAALESPRDLTAAELRIETFFPANAASAATWSTLLGRAKDDPAGNGQSQRPIS